MHPILWLVVALMVFDHLTRWYDQCRDFGYYWSRYRGAPGFAHALYTASLYIGALLLLIFKVMVTEPTCWLFPSVEVRAIQQMRDITAQSRASLTKTFDAFLADREPADPKDRKTSR